MMPEQSFRAQRRRLVAAASVAVLFVLFALLAKSPAPEIALADAPRADLELSAAPSSGEFSATESFSIRYTLLNRGPAAAARVNLRVGLPKNVVV
ncbi:hypothetical protein FBQ82_04855, partial [Anaerolineae bacterium CFX7]|nr:hypothetical protein [Anaerolineae bacterium CFX7]